MTRTLLLASLAVVACTSAPREPEGTDMAEVDALLESAQRSATIHQERMARRDLLLSEMGGIGGVSTDDLRRYLAQAFGDGNPGAPLAAVLLDMADAAAAVEVSAGESPMFRFVPERDRLVSLSWQASGCTSDLIGGALDALADGMEVTRE